MNQLLTTAALLSAAAVASAQTIDVYKFGNCGCCDKWVEHLRSKLIYATGTQEAVIEIPANAGDIKKSEFLMEE